MAKLHRLTVTQADLAYKDGKKSTVVSDQKQSITIDLDLIDAVGMQPGQYVLITNASNAILWQTYIMPGKRGSGVICLNGPPARLFQRGDTIIVLAEIWLKVSDLFLLTTRVALFNDEDLNATPEEKNRLMKVLTLPWKSMPEPE
jgi:aspartate 1-decarboxylase